MTELLLDVTFPCCTCDGATTVTIQCRGKGLEAGPRTIAATQVPCYCCGAYNYVYFHPTGEVVAVGPVEDPEKDGQAPRRVLVPSRN